MALTPGARLGPYEIVSPLGAGGMGTVYRARDTRLGRTVAIKVLHPDTAADLDRRTRFEREARLLSALSHPRVCAFYDIGQQNGFDFLVMEHLEGETLAARLERGPLPIDDALEIGAQIAAGLHEAHRTGITHRDLKPANVMLTRTGARLLDFGLARLRPAAASATSITGTVLTAEHTLVGTIPYMSPEQLRGADVDSRSDIFSLGVVLYEALTGKRPFNGDAPASIMAGILERDPPGLSTDLPGAPPALERLLRHCLIKNPDDRWQSARDLEIELSAMRGAPVATASRPSSAHRRWRAGAGQVALAIVAATAAVVWIGTHNDAGSEAPAPLVQFAIQLAAGESIHDHSSSSVALSADGARIAYAVNTRKGRGVFVRAFDTASGALVPGTDRATSPMFSPDGQWLAFESGGALKKVRIDGGTAVRLCDLPYYAGGSWGRDGIVVAPSFTSGLFHVDASGGRPTRLTTVDETKGERAHVWPQVLPDGRVLFTIWTGGSFDEARIALLTPADGRYHVVLEGGFHGRHVGNRLIFARGNRLFEAPFDPDRDTVAGAPVQLVEGVAGDGGSGVAMFAVDGRGTLAYIPGIQQPVPRSIVEVDQSGAQRTISDAARAFVALRLSPDERRLAVWIEEAVAAVWLKDMSRDPLTRLTFSGDDHGPVWSPDGRRIAYENGRASTHRIFVRAADVPGEDRQITSGDHHHYLNDWSPDGASLLYTEYHPESGADLWLVNAEGPPQPRPFRATPFAETHATFSPDGRWIAYVANDSDANEVYVQSASGGGDRTQISSGGGDEPAWSRKGDRLFYRTGPRMMSVPVTPGDSFSAGRPEPLFEGMYHYNVSPNRTYDVTSDGRFIMVALPDPSSTPRQVTVILNRLKCGIVAAMADVGAGTIHRELNTNFRSLWDLYLKFTGSEIADGLLRAWSRRSKYEVTGRAGKGSELLQRGQFARVVWPIPDAPQSFGE
jgi:eukaryotic-like serine/threonine-protein kinase